MGVDTFKPGFRLSPTDVVILIAGGVASAYATRAERWVAVAITFVVLHFCLFCNVLRMSRSLELVWAGIFSALAVAAGTTGRVPWWLVFSISSAATLVLAVVQIRRPSYHGVGWKLLNPHLPEWWESTAGGGRVARP